MSEDQTKVEPKKEDTKIDDLLSILNFKDEKDIEILKANPQILETLAINVKSRREANQEAKSYREKLEKIELEKKKTDEENLIKQGEYKTLYEEANKKLTEKEQQIKEKNIELELRLHAAKNGLKKDEYLKLFDKSLLNIDENGKISNIDDTFKEFQKNNMELFSVSGKVVPEATKSNLGSVPTSIDALREKALNSRDQKDIVAYYSEYKKQNKT